jgi:hypothetical protein
MAGIPDGYKRSITVWFARLDGQAAPQTETAFARQAAA